MRGRVSPWRSPARTDRAASVGVYARVPEALKNSLADYAASEGLTLSRALVELLERAFAAMGEEQSIDKLYEKLRRMKEELARSDARRRERARSVPDDAAAIFTDPELASSGLTEAEARAARGEIEVRRQEVGAIGKARAIGDRRGLVKFVSDPRTDEILGGPHSRPPRGRPPARPDGGHELARA